MTVKESKAFIKQKRINLLTYAIQQSEKQLLNSRKLIKALMGDLTTLKGMLKDERKR